MRRKRSTCFGTPIPLSNFISNHSLAQSKCVPRRPRHARILTTIITASALTEGHLLQFQASGRRRLGRAIRPDGKRNWIVEDANGVTTSISPKQVTYIVGPSSDLAEVAELETTCISLAAESSELLEVAWELVSSGEGIDGGITATVDHIAQIVYDDTSPESLFTAFILLSQDAIFFKERIIKGQNFYEARRPEIVEEARALKVLTAKREEEGVSKRKDLLKACQEGDLAFFKLLLAEDADALLSCLKLMAVELESGPNVDERYGTNRFSAFQQMAAPEQSLVRDTLKALDKPLLPSSALHVLVSLDVFSLHENLPLLRADLLYRRTFSDDLLQEANRLVAASVPDSDEDRRVDLSHLIAFAIDSEDTTEVDDAISWDESSDRIFVHIADPSRYFPDGPANPLIAEALRRTATLYLPTEKMTIFPDTLASDLFSLNGSHADGCALTFGFRIREDGVLEEESLSTQPTRVSTPVRLTYEEVDSILEDTSHEQHQILRSLLDKANMRKDWRINEGGAIVIKSPFAHVKVKNADSDEPEVELGSIDADGPSWVLVSELMIAACTVGATIAEAAGLPVPFRGQEPFDYPPDEVLDSIPDGPARAALAFRNASGSEMKTEVIEHASLGLDAYLQVTSPIRRSTDLLTHFQLKAHLRGEVTPYSTEDVNRVIATSLDMGRTLRNVENRTKKYWQIEYLRRLGPNILHRATFVKPQGEKTQVGFFHLDEYSMQIIAYMTAGLKPGAEVQVKVKVAEPRTGMIRAECITQPPQLTAAELDKLLEDSFSDITSDSDSL